MQKLQATTLEDFFAAEILQRYPHLQDTCISDRAAIFCIPVTVKPHNYVTSLSVVTNTYRGQNPWDPSLKAEYDVNRELQGQVNSAITEQVQGVIATVRATHPSNAQHLLSEWRHLESLLGSRPDFAALKHELSAALYALQPPVPVPVPHPLPVPVPAPHAVPVPVPVPVPAPTLPTPGSTHVPYASHVYGQQPIPIPSPSVGNPVYPVQEPSTSTTEPKAKAKANPKISDDCTVFVKGLPKETSVDELKDLANKFANCVNLGYSLQTNPKYATATTFFNYASAADASKVVASLTGHSFKGTTLQSNLKSDRPSRGASNQPRNEPSRPTATTSNTDSAMVTVTVTEQILEKLKDRAFLERVQQEHNVLLDCTSVTGVGSTIFVKPQSLTTTRIAMDAAAAALKHVDYSQTVNVDNQKRFFIMSRVNGFVKKISSRIDVKMVPRRDQASTSRGRGGGRSRHGSGHAIAVSGDNEADVLRTVNEINRLQGTTCIVTRFGYWTKAEKKLIQLSLASLKLAYNLGFPKPSDKEKSKFDQKEASKSTSSAATGDDSDSDSDSDDEIDDSDAHSDTASVATAGSEDSVDPDALDAPKMFCKLKLICSTTDKEKLIAKIPTTFVHHTLNMTSGEAASLMSKAPSEASTSRGRGRGRGRGGRRKGDREESVLGRISRETCVLIAFDKKKKQVLFTAASESDLTSAIAKVQSVIQ